MEHTRNTAVEEKNTSSVCPWGGDWVEELWGQTNSGHNTVDPVWNKSVISLEFQNILPYLQCQSGNLLLNPCDSSNSSSHSGSPVFNDYLHWFGILSVRWHFPWVIPCVIFAHSLRITNGDVMTIVIIVIRPPTYQSPHSACRLSFYSVLEPEFKNSFAWHWIWKTYGNNRQWMKHCPAGFKSVFFLIYLLLFFILR